MNTSVEQLIVTAVTPAVMLSACALLALGLDNQAARMTTRLRDLAREFRSLPDSSSRRPAIRQQVTILARRHSHYTHSLMCTYAALLAFAITSLSALASGYTGWTAAGPLMFFIAGVVMLVAAASFTLLAVRMSRQAVMFEEREVRGEPKDPS